MAKNVATGVTVALLILMVVLAYGQKHHECWKGHLIKRHSIKVFEPCGSVSPQM